MPAPTPVFSRHTRTMSPPLSSAPSLTTQSQQNKFHVVTRLAIEGNAKQGESGAGIKMYLKISLPLDSVTPGSTIPLFPEENVKILTSQVHPIDANSVPYNFSSTISPALHNAARALMLPARSQRSYLSLFGLSPVASPSISSSKYPSSSSSSNTTPVLDDKYTGHILVSGYHVSFVLPREFPPRSSLGNGPADVDTTPLPNRRRRPSVSEKNVLQFMAAIELMVPFLSRPPRAPYLLSIPTPRCLSNNIKLRIFPPSTSSSSFASLSSAEEEASTWDLTSDPYVAPTALRRSRTNSYTHFADDESSDSSNTGFADGCGIQGTFPSTERLRVRWAVPMKLIDLPAGGDGRRKVGVREVKGEMTCAMIGKGKDTSVGGSGKEGVIMKIEYKGTCKGVWFPGVATLLGMDVGLLARNSDVTWVDGTEGKWTVGGGSGLPGWDVAGVPPMRPEWTDASPDTPMSHASELRPTPATRTDSNASTSSGVSLLRVPLPAHNVPDYSFENSATSSAPSGTLSSLNSLPTNSPNGLRSRATSISSANGALEQNAEPRRILSPVLPVTIHVNMNELLSPFKNILTFTISGTVLVTPKSRTLTGLGSSRSSSPTPSEDETDGMEPVVLPYFNVLAADTETTVIVLRNDADGSTVDVYNPSGDVREAQTRKTVLQRGGFTKCGVDGERVAIRPTRAPVGYGREMGENGRAHALMRRAPNGGVLSRTSSTSSLRQAIRGAAGAAVAKPKREGPLTIAHVVATITPLLASGGGSASSSSTAVPNAYAVRVCLPVPSDRESEWLEFGFAQPSPNASTMTADTAAADDGGRPPKVDIASVSLDGVPVRFETAFVAKHDKDESLAGLRLAFEETSGKEWLTWVKVHVGDGGGGGSGGEVEFNYVCKELREGSAVKGKGKALAQMNVLLPAFALPIGRWEVRVESAGLEISPLRTNFKHQLSTAVGPRLVQYSAEEVFYPRLSFSIRSKGSSHARLRDTCARVFAVITPIVCFLLAIAFVELGAELRDVQRALERYQTTDIGTGWIDIDMLDAPPAAVTVTATVLASPGHHTPWWFFNWAPRVGTSPVGQDPVPSIPPAPSPSEEQPAPIATPSWPTERHNPPTADQRALLALESLPFPWPPRFDLLANNLTSHVHVSVDDVMNGLRKVWHIFRVVYHYPLPPP